MEGFGDLFGSIGEMLGGLREAVGDRAGEAMLEAAGGVRGEGDDETTTYDRVLAGRKRAPNINDI